jgi:signal peptidase II
MKTSTDPSRSERSDSQGTLIVYGLAALLFGLDQLSKALVLSHLSFRVPYPVLEPWLYFTHVYNIGAAFSMFEGQKFLLSGIALAVAGWIIWHERRLQERHPLHLAALGCILAGALGNVADRLRLGHVVDFIDIHNAGGNIWPIFNVADMCINLGVGLLVLYFWRYPESKEERSLRTEASIEKS